MDEVRIERLMTKHGRDTLCVIIRDWPTTEKYKDKPELVASLEYLVCFFKGLIVNESRSKLEEKNKESMFEKERKL